MEYSPMVFRLFELDHGGGGGGGRREVCRGMSARVQVENTFYVRCLFCIVQKSNVSRLFARESNWKLVQRSMSIFFFCFFSNFWPVLPLAAIVMFRACMGIGRSKNPDAMEKWRDFEVARSFVRSVQHGLFCFFKDPVLLL